jgi:acyl carrier protein
MLNMRPPPSLPMVTALVFGGLVPVAARPAIAAPVTAPAKPARKHQTPAASEIEKKLRKLVAEQLDVAMDKVVPHARFVEDLKADSLALVELVLAAEEAFKIDIPDEDTEKIKTVQDAIRYVETRAK